MSKPIVQRLIAALIVATVFTASFATLVSAAVPNAPFAQTLRAKQVRGTLPGGQFAKIWLGLEPEQFGDQVTVISEWDRADAAQNGVGFFILDEQGLPGAIAGEALNNIAMASGTANFILNGPSNTLGASFNAFGLSRYTIIVYNDSNSDANFTLTATNGFISDDSGQVTDPNASQVVTTTVATEAPAPAAAPVTTTTATTTTAPAPAVETTATTTSTTPTVTTTTAPVAVAPTTQPGVVSAAQLQGDLPEQNDQHFLGLKPTQRDAEISLSLTFDPQDSSELARRLNFWVLDQAGFTQFQAGANPSEVAIAAGNRTLRADTNERVANFKAVGEGEYVVLVYNTSQVPGSYTISAVGGLLSDDSGQTRTAQLAAVSNTAAVTTTTTTTTAPTTAPVAATTTTTATTATTAARTGTPGGTYTVKAGDTIALIARDIYGDYQLYQQICTFNGLANCNVIEIGDVIKLPTQAQITTGVTQPAAAATPVATATRAATTSATTTTTTTTTSPVTSTTTVAPTTAVTRTGTITPTTTATTTSGATSANIVDTAIANGGFKTLVAALDATGLDATLRGPGPFTVFAPTDAAFAALPAGALDRLLADPTGQLTDILRYHVITNELTTADLSDDLEATTVQGKPVKFDVQGNTIQINGATILTKDIQTSNGVIQVIDAVIIPPAE